MFVYRPASWHGLYIHSLARHCRGQRCQTYGLPSQQSHPAEQNHVVEEVTAGSERNREETGHTVGGYKHCGQRTLLAVTLSGRTCPEGMRSQPKLGDLEVYIHRSYKGEQPMSVSIGASKAWPVPLWECYPAVKG